jgi:H+/Cl- antiporter ClcA
MISLTSFRKRLALPKTSWQLCLLAIIGGTASALLIVLFTLSIEAFQNLYIVKKDNYNSLDQLSRFDLPIIGALIILCFAWLTGYKYLRTGIPLVLHRLKVANGVMPFKNTLNQFWGSAVALASGFSVGREGPAVHLGAACSSYIGSKLKLPHNATRTLCGCGVAAGIAASFNTPIAAVLFVMEVILREYKIHMFIPIMLSAIVGSLITRNVFGSVHEFDYFSKIAIEYSHYPALIVLGVFLGLIAFAFNRYLVLIIKHAANYHIVPRLMLAAFITGGLGFVIPYAMGTGLSAVEFSLNNQFELQLLLGLLIAKILMTIFALGLGIPGGVIGPILGIGSVAGAIIVVITAYFLPQMTSTSDFVLMGMAGFMAATLNAPLTALLTVVELSNQIEIVVPAMIVITISCLISGQVFKNRSLFNMQADIQGLVYSTPLVEKSLQKIGVIGAINENFTLIKLASTQSNVQQIADALNQNVTTDGQENTVIVKNTSDKNVQYHWVYSKENDGSSEIINHTLLPISSQATLAEAYHALVESRAGGVYIYHDNPNEIIGMIAFEQIRLYLVEGKIS